MLACDIYDTFLVCVFSTCIQHVYLARVSSTCIQHVYSARVSSSCIQHVYPARVSSTAKQCTVLQHASHTRPLTHLSLPIATRCHLTIFCIETLLYLMAIITWLSIHSPMHGCNALPPVLCRRTGKNSIVDCVTLSSC